MTINSIREALPHIREALGYLVRCWDALNKAESLLEVEIGVDDLSSLAVDLDCPEESELLTTAQLAEWLAECFS